MLPRDTLSLAQVARLAAASPLVPVGDPRQQAFQRALAGQLGQTLPAAVLARLDDGSYLVRVADMAARKVDNPATAALARTPLLGAPTAELDQIAGALRRGLEHSGLFYESHVAELAQGARPLAELAAEPQAKGQMRSAVDPDTAQFINLQLGAHEQGRAAWQ